MKQFYTYMWLREDGTPYYVGKGQGKRAFRNGCPTRAVIPEWIDEPDTAHIVVYPMGSEAEAFEAEIALIWYYGRKDLGTGCLRNLTSGGEGTSGKSEDARKRISKAMSSRIVSESTREKGRQRLKNKPPMHLGFKHSEEARRKMSERGKGRTAWNKGVKATPEQIEANRKGHLGITWPIGRNPNNGWLGRKLTEEHKKKIGLANSKRRTQHEHSI